MKEPFLEKLCEGLYYGVKRIKVNYKDSKRTICFKLIYLIPLAILMYVPCVIILGVIEMGNPFNGLKDIFKEAK